MKKLGSKEIIGLMREAYEERLSSLLKEMEIYNSKGQLVLGKDLKVIHEPSGFVYTVRGVTGEPGTAKIVLRAPEEPRIEPSEKASDIVDDMADDLDDLKPSDVLEDANPEDEDEEDKKDYGKKAYPSEKTPPQQDVGEVMFVIDQKEFEKHYKEA